MDDLTRNLESIPVSVEDFAVIIEESIKSWLNGSSVIIGKFKILINTLAGEEYYYHTAAMRDIATFYDGLSEDLKMNFQQAIIQILDADPSPDQRVLEQIAVLVLDCKIVNQKIKESLMRLSESYPGEISNARRSLLKNVAGKMV